MKVELHCHTRISDGSCSFEEVLELADQEAVTCAACSKVVATQIKKKLKVRT